MAQLETNTSVESLGYKQELKRSLTFVDLLIYGMVFMVPIAPFGIYGYVAQGSKGMVALAYLIGMVGMANSARRCSPLNSAQKDEERPRLVLSDIVECNILAIMLYLFSPL